MIITLDKAEILEATYNADPAIVQRRMDALKAYHEKKFTKPNESNKPFTVTKVRGSGNDLKASHERTSDIFLKKMGYKL